MPVSRAFSSNLIINAKHLGTGMKRASQLLVTLDIGTSETKALAFARNGGGGAQLSVVSESSGDNSTLLGGGGCIVAGSRLPSQGVRKGVIVHLEHAAEQVSKVLKEVQAAAGSNVSEVVCVLSGVHLQGSNHQGVVPVRHREVSAADVDRVLEAARQVILPNDREVLHVVPQEFVVDDQDGIRDPRGMAGGRLEARVHLISGTASLAKNMVKCVNLSGRMVKEFVVGGFAAARAVTSEEERELGVVVLDIGSGTTDVTVMVRGAVRHLSVIPVGGGHFTFDLAAGLKTPLVAAERLKCAYGEARIRSVSGDEAIEVASTGKRAPRYVTRRALAEILEPRVRDLFEMVGREIARTGYDKYVHAGVVLTGGSAKLLRIDALAEDVLCCPVRIGAPLSVSGSFEGGYDPSCAAVVGAGMLEASLSAHSPMASRGCSPLTKWVKGVGNWLGQHF